MSDRTLMDCAQAARMYSEEDAHIIADAAEEILCLRFRVMELTDALIDARHNGLIYWRPMTERGVVEQATMMARIDAVLIKEAKP